MKRFNGNLAVMFNQIDRQKLLLEARTAANTGGTAKALADQEMALNEELQPLKEEFENLKNVALIPLIVAVPQRLPHSSTVPSAWPCTRSASSASGL